MNFTVTNVSVFHTIQDGQYIIQKLALKGVDLFGFEVANEQTLNVASMNGIGNYGDLTIYIVPKIGNLLLDDTIFDIEIERQGDETRSHGRILIQQEEFLKMRQDFMDFRQKFSAISISASVIEDRVLAHNPIKIFQKLKINGIEFVLK